MKGLANGDEEAKLKAIEQQKTKLFNARMSLRHGVSSLGIHYASSQEPSESIQEEIRATALDLEQVVRALEDMESTSPGTYSTRLNEFRTLLSIYQDLEEKLRG